MARASELYDVVVERMTEDGIERETYEEKVAGMHVESVMSEIRRTPDVMAVEYEKSY